MEFGNDYCVDSKLYKLKHAIDNAGSDLTVVNYCVDELKKCVEKTRNTGFFKSLNPDIRERIFPDGSFESWRLTIDQESSQKLCSLRSSAEKIDCINKHKVYKQIAQELFSVGNVHDSLQMLVRAREYTKSNVQNAILIHDIIKYGFISGIPGLDYPPLFTQLHRFSHKSTDFALDGEGNETEQDIHFYENVLPHNICVLEGLYSLMTGNFKEAGTKLLSFCTGSNHWKESGLINTVFSMHDTVVYVTMCFLASFDRKSIKKHLINSPTFHMWQETCPEMSAVLKAFVGLDYKTFLSLVSKVPLNQDLLLSKNADLLLKNIQRQTIIQFIQPYSAVSFSKLVDSLGIPIDTLLPELELLIEKEVIDAKLDTVKGIILIQCNSNRSRSKTVEQVFTAGEAFQNLAESVLMRMSLSKTTIPSNDANTIFE